MQCVQQPDKKVHLRFQPPKTKWYIFIKIKLWLFFFSVYKVITPLTSREWHILTSGLDIWNRIATKYIYCFFWGRKLRSHTYPVRFGFFIECHTNVHGLFNAKTILVEEQYVKLLTVVEGDPKAPFSIATTARFRWRRYSFSRIPPLYPWYVPYNAECWARRYQVPFFKFLVWRDLVLNPGVPGHWQTLYPLDQVLILFNL